MGGAQVSEKHAGFLINLGGASCADIVALMDKVRDEVYRRTAWSWSRRSKHWDSEPPRRGGEDNEFIIISGMSGAGKSQAASFMEDMGFFCVDNLPVPLIPKLAELIMAGSWVYERVVLVSDIRGGQNLDGLLQALDTLKGMRCSFEILFIEASDETIISGIRRPAAVTPWPMEEPAWRRLCGRSAGRWSPSAPGQTISSIPLLCPPPSCGALFCRSSAGESGAREMSVSVISFGFKYGIPIEADLVFDVRFLPNPYYVEELRSLTGLEPAVRDYVLNGDQAARFMAKLTDLIDFLLPQYVEEGKSALVIAVGCTGGHHRSVAVDPGVGGPHQGVGLSGG